MSQDQQFLGAQLALETILAQVMSQADKAIFDYRAECGHRGDGQWAESLARPSRKS